MRADLSGSELSQPNGRAARFSAFEWLLIGMFAGLILVVRVAFHLPLKIPGHSGIAWMALLVTARAAVPRIGAATATGVMAGFLAIFLGVGDRGALTTLLASGAAGLGVDVVCARTRGQLGWVTCAVAGLAGNLCKLGVKVLLEIGVGIPAGFVLFGRLPVALSHAAAGLAGGVLGFLVVRALRRAGYFSYLAARRS